jgi:hypothetical protein
MRSIIPQGKRFGRQTFGARRRPTQGVNGVDGGNRSMRVYRLAAASNFRQPSQHAVVLARRMTCRAWS